MPRFYYKAATASGDVLEGEMDSASQEGVIRQLQAQGHIPIRAEAMDAKRVSSTTSIWSQIFRRAPGASEVQLFTTELATLLQAGLELDKALEMLESLAAPGPFREMIADLYQQVRGGADLSAGLASWGRLFTPFYINLIRAGEASGTLASVLGTLAQFLENARVMRDGLSAALIYPVILLVSSLFALSIILGVVVPEISLMFDDAGQRLPWYTRMVVALGDIMERYWWVILALLVMAVLGLRHTASTASGRLRLDGLLLDIPLFGTLIRKLEAARFSRSLGIMLSNGVPLLEAISISKDIASNQIVATSLSRVAASVHQGEGLASPLQREAVLPELALKLIHVGEESSQLEGMLLKVAEIYEHEVETGIKRIIAILGPLLILVLAAMIAGIMISVIMPILNINDLAF
jgi:general secretion pathway protein F